MNTCIIQKGDLILHLNLALKPRFCQPISLKNYKVYLRKTLKG